MALTTAGKRLIGEAKKLRSVAQALRNEARAIKGEIAGASRAGTVSDRQFIRLPSKGDGVRCFIVHSPPLGVRYRAS